MLSEILVDGAVNFNQKKRKYRIYEKIKVSHMATAINNVLDRGFLEPKKNNRPRGRTVGSLPCNNPAPSWSAVLKACWKYLSKRSGSEGTGSKPFLGPIMEKAVHNSEKLVYSDHTRATWKAEGLVFRNPLGVNRDITAWKVLFMTVDLSNSLKNGDWFQCAIHESKLNELSTFRSLSRCSRFLDFYRKTGYLKVLYKKSTKGNGERKYCVIRISKKAFYDAGITPDELEREILRKNKNMSRRRTTPGYPEYEQAKANLFKLNREGRRLDRELHKSRKAAKEKLEQERFNSQNAEQLKREALQVFIQMYESTPGASRDEVIREVIRKFPRFKNCFDYRMN